MKSIRQISEILKLTPRAVASRFNKQGIKGKKRVLTYFYSQSQIEQISFKKHINPRYPKLSDSKYYKVQIDILCMYFMLDNRTASEVSRVLNLPICICERTIKYYKERNCLIIKSKL